MKEVLSNYVKVKSILESRGVYILSRKPRVWIPRATYHITSRGNRKAAIFVDDADYLTYMELIQRVRRKFPFILHSYCLMPNHIHLLLETSDHHPKHIMKMLHTCYAMYFNKRHELVGQLFQGRYDAQLIDSLNYFLEASRYIHWNPVEAEMVQNPEDYLWSSYSAFLVDSPHPFVTTERIFSYYPEPQRDNYIRFVINKLGDSPLVP
jgi:putative transposase